MRNPAKFVLGSASRETLTLDLPPHAPPLCPTVLLSRTPRIGEGLEDARHHALQRRRHSPEGVAEGRWRRGLRHQADDEAHGRAQGYSVREQEEEGRGLFRIDVVGALRGAGEGKAHEPGSDTGHGGLGGPDLAEASLQ